MDAAELNPLGLHRVRSSDTPDFAELLAIYRQAHPASERKPSSALAEMVLRDDYSFLALTLHGHVAGFAIVAYLPGGDAGLLEYMAIAADRRSQGLGKILFQRLVTLPALHGRYLLAEVDSEREASDDRADRLRRKNFYRMLGCRQLAGLDYRMPSVSGSVPPAMDILVYRDPLPDALGKAQLGSWLEAIYVNVYAQPATDPRIDTMLDTVHDPAELI
jgi:GNAT superfamily N-acetyltransferase